MSTQYFAQDFILYSLWLFVKIAVFVATTSLLENSRINCTGATTAFIKVQSQSGLYQHESTFTPTHPPILSPLYYTSTVQQPHARPYRLPYRITTTNTSKYSSRIHIRAYTYMPLINVLYKCLLGLQHAIVSIELLAAKRQCFSGSLIARLRVSLIPRSDAQRCRLSWSHNCICYFLKKDFFFSLLIFCTFLYYIYINF